MYKVLVVEDQPSIRSILVASELRLDIVEAKSGSEALDRLALRDSEATRELPVAMPGATSYVTKPFNADELREAQKPHLVVLAAHTKPVASAKRKRILLVDDQEPIRRIMTRALKKSLLDLDIVEAGDGREALAKLDESHFNLMVLDVEMPGMGGLEVLRELKQRPSLADLIVIILSGDIEPIQMQKGLHGGAISYITKPFSAREMVLVIERHLNDHFAELVQED